MDVVRNTGGLRGVPELLNTATASRSESRDVIRRQVRLVYESLRQKLGLFLELCAERQYVTRLTNRMLRVDRPDKGVYESDHLLFLQRRPWHCMRPSQFRNQG